MKIVRYFSLLLFVSYVCAEENAPDLMSETRKHKKKHWHAETKNVGYAQNKLPVPITPCQSRQLPFFEDATIHHGSAVEPSIAVNPLDPDEIVAWWQQDRITDSGALLAGRAYTRNGGKVWHRNTVPAVQTLDQICTGGYTDRVSDIWLAWSIDGAKLYGSSLPFNITQNMNTLDQQGVVVSISLDGGKTWNGIQRLAATQDAFNAPGSTELPFDDKPSVTADRNNVNFAYATWERFRTVFSEFADTFFTRTTNQGLIWEDSRIIYNPQHDTSTSPLNGLSTFNNMVVVLPNSVLPCDARGNLLTFMTRTLMNPTTQIEFFDYAFIRSTDLGVTWDMAATVALPAEQLNPNGNAFVFTGGYTYDSMGNITGGVGELLRTAGSATFSIAVHPITGAIYLAFQSSQFRPDFLPQIGIIISRDGGFTWTEPVMVNQTPQNAPNPQAFTPAIAVTADGYVGIVYSDFRKSNIPLPNTEPTKTNTWIDIFKDVFPAPGSTGVGLDFDQEVRLSHSYIAQNGPTTTTGIMTNGDYSFVVANDDTFYAAFTQTHNGPFSPATVIAVDPETGTKLFLDDNFRQSPYVSIIKRK